MTPSNPMYTTCLACRQWLKDCNISEGGQPKSKGKKNPKKPRQGSDKGGNKKPSGPKKPKNNNKSKTGGKAKAAKGKKKPSP